MAIYKKNSTDNSVLINSLEHASRGQEYVNFFHTHKQDLINIFNEYDSLGSQNKLGELNKINLTPDEEDLCRLIYRNRKNTLRETILNNQGNIPFNKKYCWYCNMKNVRTLDHFIPKEETDPYPELAFYINNLLLCCDNCNDRKKGAYKDASNNMYYLNPYYFNRAEVSFLKIHINIINGIPIHNYYVDYSQITSQEIKIAIQHQYETKPFKLIEIFDNDANDLIDELINDYHDSNCPPKSDFKDKLIKKTNRLTSQRGINNYEVVLYNEILNNAPVFDFITS